MYQECHPYATLITFAALGMFRLWAHVLTKLTEITISHLRDFGKTPTKKYPWMASPALERSLIIRVRSSDYDRKSQLNLDHKLALTFSVSLPSKMSGFRTHRSMVGAYPQDKTVGLNESSLL